MVDRISALTKFYILLVYEGTSFSWGRFYLEIRKPPESTNILHSYIRIMAYASFEIDFKPINF